MLFSNTFVWNENLIRSSKTSGEGIWKSLEKQNKSFAGTDSLAQDLKGILWVRINLGGIQLKNWPNLKNENVTILKLLHIQLSLALVALPSVESLNSMSRNWIRPPFVKSQFIFQEYRNFLGPKRPRRPQKPPQACSISHHHRPATQVLLFPSAILTKEGIQGFFSLLIGLSWQTAAGYRWNRSQPLITSQPLWHWGTSYVGHVLAW